MTPSRQQIPVRVMPISTHPHLMDPEPTAKLHKAPRTDISQNQGKFRIHFNFPGRNHPDHDDHGYGPLATVVESFMDPDTLISMHQHRNEEIIS